MQTSHEFMIFIGVQDCNKSTSPSWSAPLNMQTSLRNCCGGIVRVSITREAARPALHEEGRIRHQGPHPHSPAGFLASSSNTAAHCKSLRGACNDTHQPDVAAAESQFRHNIREDVAWRRDGSSCLWTSFRWTP